MIDFDKIQDSPHILDLLIKMEDVLDSLDIYVFKNWFDGEVILGPAIRRHWLGMTLRFEQMPDPQGGKRLLKYGIVCEFKKMQQGDQVKTKPDGRKQTVWTVKINMPRRLIDDFNAGELDVYDELIDADDVQDAADQGSTENSVALDQEQETDSDDQ